MNPNDPLPSFTDASVTEQHMSESIKCTDVTVGCVYTPSSASGREYDMSMFSLFTSALYCEAR